MSGQPYKKFTDVNKFRNEYLDTLNMQASIDDMNLQANKNYKATGSLPAVSQMKDSRTTSEILADTEKLKIDIVTALSKISNPQFAAAVVQRIVSSPINQDNSLLIFTAQRVNDLVEKLGKIYAYGIKGDTNDVQQIVNFLVSMYNDKNILASTTQDFLNRYNGPNYGSFGRSSSDALQNSKSILIKAKGTLNTLYNLINILHTGGVDGSIRMTQRGVDLLQGHMDRIFSIDMLMNILVRLIPEQNILSIIDQSVANIIDNGIDPSDQTMAKILSYKDFLSYGIPSSANISLTEKKLITLVTTLQDIVSKRYYNGLNTMMDNITQSLDNFESILMPSEKWDQDSLNRLNTDVVNLMRQLQDTTNTLNNEQSPIPVVQQPNAPNDNEGSIRSGISDGDYGSVRSGATSNYGSVRSGATSNYGSVRSDTSSNQQRQADLQQSRLDITNLIMNSDPQDIADIIEHINDPDVYDNNTLLNYLLNPDNNYTLGDYGIAGFGLRKQQRKRGRPKGSGLQRKYSEVVKSSTATDKGIDEDRRFIKFGKYLINTKKLNDSILAVKRPSGNNIIEFPTQHITSNFKNVIKTMIGGGMPKYEELDRLSEPEKAYLHKLASKANVIDKFSIPAPSKNQHEKDIHEFEVMKGEIMSGNDNNDLIKKFKLHILKLSKTGALPKREVMELLETLLELGY